MVIAVLWSVPSYSVCTSLDRHFYKRQRARVPRQVRRVCAVRAARKLITLKQFRSARHVACYLGTSEEFDTRYVLRAIHQCGKTLYLPVITDIRAGRMVFQRCDPGERLELNAFGISQPQFCAEKIAPLDFLDLIIAPLLAFDSQGRRMGMGGGFYDRALTSRLKRWRPASPFYLGLAYELQGCSRLKSNHWDVPLDGILTERGFRCFR